jgi:hypothetical protein
MLLFGSERFEHQNGSARVSLIPAHPPCRCLRPKDVFGFSQVPREPPYAYAVLLDSGRAWVPSLRGTSVLPPDNRTRRASTIMELSKLDHTA